MITNKDIYKPAVCRLYFFGIIAALYKGRMGYEYSIGGQKPNIAAVRRAKYFNKQACEYLRSAAVVGEKYNIR